MRRPLRLSKALLPSWTACAFLVLLPACHEERNAKPEATAKAATALPGQEMLKTELFFGRGIPGGGLVSETEWQAFLEKEVTPRFPDGLSAFEVQGQWRDVQGKVVREPSKMLVLIHEDSPAKRKSLEEVIAAYKAQFKQESVMRLTQRVHADF